MWLLWERTKKNLDVSSFLSFLQEKIPQLDAFPHIISWFSDHVALFQTDSLLLLKVSILSKFSQNTQQVFYWFWKPKWLWSITYCGKEHIVYFSFRLAWFKKGLYFESKKFRPKVGLFSFLFFIAGDDIKWSNGDYGCFEVLLSK